MKRGGKKTEKTQHCQNFSLIMTICFFVSVHSVFPFGLGIKFDAVEIVKSFFFALFSVKKTKIKTDNLLLCWCVSFFFSEQEFLQKPFYFWWLWQSLIIFVVLAYGPLSNKHLFFFFCIDLKFPHSNLLEKSKI